MFFFEFSHGWGLTAVIWYQIQEINEQHVTIPQIAFICRGSGGLGKRALAGIWFPAPWSLNVFDSMLQTWSLAPPKITVKLKLGECNTVPAVRKDACTFLSLQAKKPKNLLLKHVWRAWGGWVDAEKSYESVSVKFELFGREKSREICQVLNTSNSSSKPPNSKNWKIDFFTKNIFSVF